MALRLFLGNAAAPYTPATIRGTWSDAALTGASALSRRKSGANTTAAKGETSSSSTWSTLLRRFVSEPVNNPGTLSGAFTLVFGALESSSSANMNFKLHIYVTVGSTDVVRGTLASNLIGTTEFPILGLGLGAAGVQATGTVTAVAVQPGDRLVIEVGYRANNTSTSSFTGTLYYGGTGADLTNGDNHVTTRPGWIDFAHASFHDAFDIPFRTGTTTTTVGVTQQSWDPSKVKSVATVTTVAAGSSTPSAYKSMRTTTGNVRPPGRPPVGVSEEGSFTTGSSTRDGGELTTDPDDAHIGSAVRVASTTAESVSNLVTHKDIPYALIQGDHDLSPPDIDLLTAPPPPTPQAPLRFIAQDIRTHRFLTYELPLVDVQITWTLSGPTMLSARLTPESPTLRELGITAWATWIHVEQDGQLLASMILQPTKIDGDDYTVEAMGFSGYAQGMAYLSEDLFVRTDACDVMRRIWNHLQSFPDAYLGVQLTATMSGLLLGIPALQKVDADGFLEFELGDQVSPPTRELPEGTELAIVSYVRDPETGILTVTYNDGAVFLNLPVMEPAKPYVLAWYNDTDCGQEFDNLAKTAKVEYRETVAWATEGDIAVIPVTTRKIELAYPRLGRKRYDLRCAQDENMLAAIPLEEATGAQGYASYVLTRGVGDGRDAIRGFAGAPDPRRVRRFAIVGDGTIHDSAAAVAYSTEELLRRRAAITVGEVVMMDWHPNAPLGSYQVGDELLITGFVPWAGYIEFWHRIISYTWEPGRNIVTLQTRRAEQFAYGRPWTEERPAPAATITSSDGGANIIQDEHGNLVSSSGQVPD